MAQREVCRSKDKNLSSPGDQCQHITSSELDCCASSNASSVTHEVSDSSNTISVEVPTLPTAIVCSTSASQNNTARRAPDILNPVQKDSTENSLAQNLNFEHDTEVVIRQTCDMISPQASCPTVDDDCGGTNMESVSPGFSVFNASIPSTLLNVSTPTLSIVGQSHSPPSSPFCSTPAIRDNSSITSEADHSLTAYSLQTVSCQRPGSDLTCTTSRCVELNECPLSQPQDSSAEYSLPSIELSGCQEPASDSHVIFSASPCIESQEHQLCETQDSSSDDDSDSKLEQCKYSVQNSCWLLTIFYPFW